jgi:hypothetical protein
MHYRHDDLETNPEKPEQLGGIEEWAKQQASVKYIGSSKQEFSAGTLPTNPEVLIFNHSPLVKAPDNTKARAQPHL